MFIKVKATCSLCKFTTTLILQLTEKGTTNRQILDFATQVCGVVGIPKVTPRVCSGVINLVGVS